MVERCGPNRATDEMVQQGVVNNVTQIIDGSIETKQNFVPMLHKMSLTSCRVYEQLFYILFSIILNIVLYRCSCICYVTSKNLNVCSRFTPLQLLAASTV